jgi:hypothetical protein
LFYDAYPEGTSIKEKQILNTFDNYIEEVEEQITGPFLDATIQVVLGQLSVDELRNKFSTNLEMYYTPIFSTIKALLELRKI